MDDDDLPAGHYRCGVCGQTYPAEQESEHPTHVVEPRELSPGFWVAIDVEESTEHARQRFGIVDRPEDLGQTP